jgi:TP901 family phage tail tape measure protein
MKLAMVAGATAAGAAVASFTRSGVKNFLSFDDAMTSSLAIMGDISGPMRQKMESAARGIAKETRFSADQVAEGYFFLASAGLDAAQSMAALPQVAAFATAGNFDLARATDLATDAQSALGLTSDDAATNLDNLTRVTDVFVRANTLANTSVEQISEAMTNKAGAAMRSVGMDIEEGAAVLAAFADQGVKGAEAGTQFAIVLRDLQTKALGNKEEFAKLGVSVFDADGEMRNMADIVGDLEGLLAGMSDEQKKATLAQLGFSDKSMGALQTLLGTSDAIRGYEEELRSASGVTEEVADKQLQSFQAQWDLAKSKITDVGISLGSFLVPKLAQAADWVSRNKETLTKVAVVLGIVAGAVTAVWVAVKIYNGVMMVWRGMMMIATAAQWLFNIAVSANPITLIILAIIALIAVIVLIATKTTWFQDLWRLVWGGIKAAALAVGRWFMDVLWRKWILGAFNAIAGFAGKTRDKVVGFFVSMKDRLLELPGKIRKGFSKIFSIVTAPFRAAFNAIAGYWNRTIGGRGFTAPSWVPFGVGGRSFTFPTIPTLAAGGIVTSPTLAMIGEAGPEAVVPLRRGGGAAAGGTTVVKFVADGSRASRLLLELLREAARVTGGGSVQVVFGRD